MSEKRSEDAEAEPKARALSLDRAQDTLASLLGSLEATEASPELLTALALCYRERGSHVEAVQAWRGALEREARPGERLVLEKQLALSLTNWASAALMEQQQTREQPARLCGSFLEEALRRYEDALQVDPTCALAHYNIGAIYASMGYLVKAARSYKQALQHDPCFIEAYVDLARIATLRGDPRRAVQRYQKALRLRPGHEPASRGLAEVFNDLGTQAKNAGHPEEAIRLYQRALRHDARSAFAWYNLGVVHSEAGRSRRARTYYEVALQLNPSFAEAHNNLGVCCNEAGDWERAFSCYAKALSIDPDYPQALNNMGGFYTLQGRLAEARQVVERALASSPEYAGAWNNLAAVAREEGDMEEAYRCHELALKYAPGSRVAQHNQLMAQNYLAGFSIDRMNRDHAAWGRAFEALHPPLPPDPTLSLDPDRPLRVGYLSPDFTQHSVSYFIEAALAHHSPACLAFCYSNAPREDAKSFHLKRLAHAWRPVRGWTAPDVAALMRRDRIDLLVELTGHTADNQLDVVAMRPAPVQLTYLGYPNTTGLTRVDYRITDALADPEDTEQRYTEELLRLPRCFLCYTPFGEIPDVGPPPQQARAHVTFACFNIMAKLNDRVLAVWARILAALPEARLFLKNKALSSPVVAARLVDRLATLGVGPERVTCSPLIPSSYQHLAAYRRADVALDTFPYNGTTTTCEALLMGVPVVTMAGPSHAHSVGRSLLHAVGLPDLVARSEDEYVAVACRLAADAPRLRALRLALREQMLRSPLGDGRGFTQELERQYRTIWRRFCERQALSSR